MKIKEVHAAILEFLPNQSFVIVEHTFHNYSHCGGIEAWNCQVYEDDNTPLENILMTSATTPGKLIAAVESKYIKYIKTLPTVEDKIEKLKRELAKLQGEEI